MSIGPGRAAQRLDAAGQRQGGTMRHAGGNREARHAGRRRLRLGSSTSGATEASPGKRDGGGRFPKASPSLGELRERRGELAVRRSGGAPRG